MQTGDERPQIFQPLHTDEFVPRPRTEEAIKAANRSLELAERALARADERFWAGRQGLAAALIAVNEQFDGQFYDVPREAVDDVEAANEALGGDEVVIDMQTHFVADRDQSTASHLIDMYRLSMPSWWDGLEGFAAYNFAEYLRCIFIETETAVAVLSSSPGVEDHKQLYNQELAATPRLLDELGGRGRLLHHTVADPTAPGELERMGKWVEEGNPVAWKVYTLGIPNMDPAAYADDTSWRDTMPGKWKAGWMLDDDGIGADFLARVTELARVGGPNVICAHKGISGLIDTGSPRDVGPAAAAHAHLNFVAYHSGYELTDVEEGPYTEETADVGTNRLVRSVREAGLGPGSNVYAELGSTWFLTTTRPREAAHVMGKLLLAVGENNVLWGTDSIWYGPTQQLVDSFRAFQIPLDMREEFGYPPLTDAVKEKILSTNAARLHGIDLAQARHNAENDDLVWIKDALEYYRDRGNPY